MKVNIYWELFIFIIFDGEKIMNEKHENAFEIKYMNLGCLTIYIFVSDLVLRMQLMIING